MQTKGGIMKYSIWSWQCHACYGTHKDIVITKGKPSSNFVRCPYCGDRMHPYILGKGFRIKPPGAKIKMAA